MKIFIILFSFCMFFNVNAIEVKCPEGSFLTEYASKISREKRVWCSKKVKGVFVKHGPEVIYNSDGTIKSKKLYELDKLQEENSENSLKSKDQSSFFRKKITSQILDINYRVYAIAPDPSGKYLIFSSSLGLEVWEIEKMHLLHRVKVKCPWPSCYCLKMSFISDHHLRCIPAQEWRYDYVFDFKTPINWVSHKNAEPSITSIASLTNNNEKSIWASYSPDLSKVWISRNYRDFNGQMWDISKKALLWEVDSFENDPYWITLRGESEGLRNIVRRCLALNTFALFSYDSFGLNTGNDTTINTMKVVASDTGSEIVQIDIGRNHLKSSIICSSDWAVFADEDSTGSESGTLGFVNLNTGQKHSAKGLPIYNASLFANDFEGLLGKFSSGATFSYDERYFVYASGKKIVFLDMQNFSIIKIIENSNSVCSVNLSFDNKYLLTEESGSGTCNRDPVNFSRRIWKLRD